MRRLLTAAMVLWAAVASAQVTVTPAPYISGSGVAKGAVTFPSTVTFGSSTTAGTMAVMAVTTTLNMATATGTGTGVITSPTTALPVGLILGVTCRVTTILAGAALGTVSIGDGIDADRFGAGIAIAAGTTTSPSNFTTAAPAFQTTAGSIVLTASAGVFSTGVLSCTTHYLSLVPASA